MCNKKIQKKTKINNQDILQDDEKIDMNQKLVVK